MVLLFSRLVLIGQAGAWGLPRWGMARIDVRANKVVQNAASGENSMQASQFTVANTSNTHPARLVFALSQTRGSHLMLGAVLLMDAQPYFFRFVCFQRLLLSSLAVCIQYTTIVKRCYLSAHTLISLSYPPIVRVTLAPPTSYYFFLFRPVELFPLFLQSRLPSSPYSFYFIICHYYSVAF